jgi:hypothetical protein
LLSLKCINEKTAISGGFQESRLALFVLLLHEPAASPPPGAGIAKVKIKVEAGEGHVWSR